MTRSSMKYRAAHGWPVTQPTCPPVGGNSIKSCELSLARTRLVVVLVCAGEAVHRSRQSVVEIEERARRAQLRGIAKIRIQLELPGGLGDERGEKMAYIEAGKAMLHQSSAGFEVIWNTDGRGAPDLRGHFGAVLAEPFQQYVAAERHSAHHELEVWMLCGQPAHHQFEVRGFARVIESPRAVHFSVAGAKHEHIPAPSEPSCLFEQSVRVLCGDFCLESMQDEQVWHSPGDGSHPHECDVVPIRGRDPLQTVVYGGNPAAHLAPDGGKVRAGEPPGGFEVRDEFGHGLQKM